MEKILFCNLDLLKKLLTEMIMQLFIEHVINF